MKEAILVSACLLGEPCRYDGKSKPCPRVISLSEKYRLIPVCPERLGGLSTPRKKAERIDKKVKCANGADVTDSFILGAEKTLAIAKETGCKKAILKSKSPSCGKDFIYDGTFSGKMVRRHGVTAEYLIQNKLMVFTEEETEKV